MFKIFPLILLAGSLCCSAKPINEEPEGLSWSFLQATGNVFITFASG